MFSSKTSSSFCVFCYRSNTTSVNKINKDVLIKSFVKFVNRFVGSDKQNNIFNRVKETFASEIPSDNLLNSCDECKLIVKSFCEGYHELKCLEMQLEWKLDKLGRIIQLANLVPSRLSHVKRVFNDVSKQDQDAGEKSHRTMIKFRRAITKASHLRQRNSQPRVLLAKINSFSASVLSTTQEYINQETNHHEDIFSDNDHYFEEFSNENDEDNNIVDTINFDVGKQLQTTKEHLNLPKLELLTEKIGGPIVQIAIIPSTSTLPIDNVGLNAWQTNEAIQQEHIIKTELSSQLTVTRESTPQFENSEENDSNNLDFEEPQPEEIEQKLSTKMTENIESENSEDSLDNATIATTSKSHQKRYSLRVERITTLKQSNEIKNDDNANVNDYATAVISFAPKPKRGRIRPSFKTQLERLQKCGHIMCYSDGCQVRFRTEESYKYHLIYHQAGNYPCQFCSIVETSLVKLSFHEYRTHSNATNVLKDKPRSNQKNKKHLWSCPRCPNKSLDSCNKYLLHFSFTHFGIGKKPSEIKPCKIPNTFTKITCKICKFQFTCKKGLRRHNREHHQPKFTHNTINMKIEDDLTEKNADNFTCKFCDSKLEHASDLAIHETEHALPKSTTAKMSKQNAVKTSKCPRCPFLYTQQTAYIKHHLRDHLKLLDADYPGACKMCSGPEVYVPNRKQHFDRFHNTALLEDPSKVFKCDYDQCSAYFLNAAQLYKHKYAIHLRNNHNCDICDKVFRTRHYLMMHKKRYHKNYDENPSFPLACDRDWCPKRFKSEGELELHKIFHAHSDRRKDKCKDNDVDRRELVCSECGKVCKSSLQLTFHLTRVHGERKFVCQECGKSFKTKDSLITHLEYHKGPDNWKFECKECGKKYVDKYKLASHMNTHTKEKPWICQFCGEKYAHRHNWRNHLKIKHGDEESAQEDIKGKFISTGIYMSRKGSKKGDCIIAGVTAEETG